MGLTPQLNHLPFPLLFQAPKMLPNRPTGYYEGFLVFILNNSPFSREEIVVVITLLRMGTTLLHCADALNITLYRARNILHSALDKMLTWDTMMEVFERCWEVVGPFHPLHRRISSIADTTHLAIPRPRTQLGGEFVWICRPRSCGHAIKCNVLVAWSAEVMVVSCWYSPKVPESEPHVSINELDLQRQQP